MKKLTFLFLLSAFFFAVYAPVITLEKIKPVTKPVSIYNIVQEQSGVNIPNHVEHYHIWLMYEQSSRLNIPVRILFRQIQQESRYNPNAISPKGAEGYMQVMPGTWNEMVRELGWPTYISKTPERNIIIGTEYLAYLRDFWADKGLSDTELWEYSLASYNAGINCVMRYNGIPPYKETKEYVNYILHYEKI